MHQVQNLSPSLASVLSQMRVIHSVSLKYEKQNASQNHTTMTMAMFITPYSLIINYIQQTIYHYAHANQHKG